jgi:hypothetical protein
MGRMVRGSIYGRGNSLPLLRNVHTSPGAHPASYTMATGGYLTMNKANHSPPTYCRDKGVELYHYPPNIPALGTQQQLCKHFQNNSLYSKTAFLLTENRK